MTQRRAPRLPLVGVLSIAFVLLPAAGIAYFGAISYQEDRGLVAAKLDAQYQSAVAIAAEVEGVIEVTLDDLAAIDARRDDALAQLRKDRQLAAFPFIIDATGKLLFPVLEPWQQPERAPGEFLSRAPRTCPERGFETCIQAIRAARRRQRQLQVARRREQGACLGADQTCAPSAKDLEAARRAFVNLARFDDTGPDALLGLARVAARDPGGRAAGASSSAGEDPKARAERLRVARVHYQALSERFGTRLDNYGISYGLLADLGRAQLSDAPDALLDFFDALLEPRYQAPVPFLEQLADQLAERLRERPLDSSGLRRLDGLLARLQTNREQAVFAAALIGEIDDVARTAGARTRGRPALTAPNRTLLFRRQDSGRVIGIVVDQPLLELVALAAQKSLSASSDLATELAPGTRAVVERPGDATGRAATTRTLASTGFGQVLPHLSLALVHHRDLPDPLDEIVEVRGQRHLAITGGLVALLLLGLVATVRGAARERELARLKSDFVSTVSHELKTPLTSIRMFGEMLQQGVAGDDREREGRYHEIIVKESQRLGLLIANLLDYSQIERGTRRYSPQPVSALELARDAVETFERFREESAGIRLHAPTGAEVADQILVDREVLVQSLLNLLGNAVKYGAPPIDVAVSIANQAPDAIVTISVADHGPGIQAAERERIFREFYRAPAAYSSGVEGTGLGLALVKRHVQAQGGEVDVASEAGKGAIFSIRFPRC